MSMSPLTLKLTLNRRYWIKENWYQLTSRVGHECCFENTSGKKQFTLDQLMSLASIDRFACISESPVTTHKADQVSESESKVLFVCEDRRLTWLPSLNGNGVYVLQQLDRSRRVVKSRVIKKQAIKTGRLTKKNIALIQNDVLQWLRLPPLSLADYYDEKSPVAFALDSALPS